MKKIIMLVMLLLSASLMAEPRLYDSQTGKYLGELGGNPYSSDSTSNPYGQYGSRYSSDSINNPYGEYGSKYSDKSPNNPYATHSPVVIDTPTVISPSEWNR
jgi:hypothetical protein